MQIIDFYPHKAFYKPGERVVLRGEIDGEGASQCKLILKIINLSEVILTEDKTFELGDDIETIEVEWQPPAGFPRGYGATIELSTIDGEVEGKKSTSFDVLQKWADFPRYGFLTDFFPGRENAIQTISSLARYHINGIQFYDWQYRHDQLLPPVDEYIDPLDRKLSLPVINDLIQACQDVNIAAMPYLAVYAASTEFWEEHKAWGLYDEDGNPLLFEDFLGLMDPSPDSPWITHLLKECEKVLGNTAFDGLHIDQYGDPKTGFDSSGAKVDIPNAFNSFIEKAKQSFPAASVTFNAVGNWPIETLAKSQQDFVYIEIWEPTPSFEDIRDIVLNAREKSNNKPVVIALYLPADRVQNVRLADAIIFSLGGSRIEIGEINRLLTDPYFPKHQAIPHNLTQALRRYYDFTVFCSELIGPHASHLLGDEIKVQDGVWKISRETAGWKCINLINTRGLNNPKWTETQPDPDTLQDFTVEFPFSSNIKEVWWASPDRGDILPTKCKWSIESKYISIQVPYLDYWTMIAIENINGDNENDRSSRA